MNDEDRLESELAAMRPVPLDDAVIHHMHAAALEQHERPTFGDRLLAVWTGAGALAACAIVTVALWQLELAPRGPTPSAQEMASRQNVAAEVERLMASR